MVYLVIGRLSSLKVIDPQVRRLLIGDSTNTTKEQTRRYSILLTIEEGRSSDAGNPGMMVTGVFMEYRALNEAHMIASVRHREVFLMR